MKRLALAVSLIAVLIAAGCGDKETVTVTEPASTSTEAQGPQIIVPSNTQEPETTIDTTPDITSTTNPEIEPDFRNIIWGMSREDVKSRETEGTILAEDDYFVLYGDVVITGLDALLSYLFNVEDQVFGANYIF